MITIVSGLPRSGTSLMMQMLQAGGLSILCDDLRPADEDNPRGYLELDKVRHLEKDAGWMVEAEGRALKVVSLLLYHLPPGFEYRVVFMHRDLDEIIRSQERMLARRGQPPGPDQAAMRRHFERHLQALREWLSRQPHLPVLDRHYADVIADPREAAAAVAAFLSLNLNQDGMAAAIDPALWRQQSGTARHNPQ
jgi:hypothetical protein